jgi:hypothetical protein
MMEIKNIRIVTRQYVINEFEVNEKSNFFLIVVKNEIIIPCVKYTPKLFAAIISKNLSL